MICYEPACLRGLKLRSELKLCRFGDAGKPASRGWGQNRPRTAQTI